MQSRIYRFEIVRAVVNGVYEALDTDNNSTVTLYEWTPATADRTAAKVRLAEIQDQLHGAAFTADASLYLVAPSAEAAEAPLKALHAHDLFTGIEPNGPPPPPPSSPLPPGPLSAPFVSSDTPFRVDPQDFEQSLKSSPPLPPIPPPAPKPSGFPWFSILAVLIFSGIAYAAGAFLGRSQPSTAAVVPPPPSSSVQDQLKNFEGVHVLRMTNKTPSNAHVAVLYQNWAGVWVFSGWQVIAPNASAPVASSPTDVFYYTAYNSFGKWQADDNSKVYRVTTNDFVYFADLQSMPSTWDTRKLRLVHGGNLNLTGK